MSGLNIDDFLKELQSKAPKPRENRNEDRIRLNHIWMNAPMHQGKIIGIPFLAKSDSSNVLLINRVRQYKHYDSDSDYERWRRILPKEYYPNLTEERSKLYDEVANAFDTIQSNGWLDNRKIKYTSYGALYMHVLRHYNKENEIIEDHSGKPAFVVFPSAKFAGAMQTSIESRIAAAGNANFIKATYNNELEGRQGFVNISFALGGGFGYEVGFNHDYSHDMNPVIDKNLKLPEEYLDLFPDFISSFLGRNHGEDNPFNDSFFLMMKSELLAIINSHTSTSETKKVENNNEPVKDLSSSQSREEPQSEPNDKGHVDPMNGLNYKGEDESPTQNISEGPSY